MIEAQGLHKVFGEVIAVDEVSFTAPDGLITGLLGPNGAGKTTSMRMLTGLVRPTRGSARVDGVDASELEVRRRLGVLPDRSGIYPRLTARENILYFGRLHGLSGEALKRRTQELIDLLDLVSVADRRSAGFSQGERMKVAIARALVHDPPNVMLDEPTNGLDVISTRAMRHLIGRLRDEGRCVLFSSHIMQEVAALCDRVVVIARGRVVADGSQEELLERTGQDSIEEAFVSLLGGEGGLQ